MLTIWLTCQWQWSVTDGQEVQECHSDPFLLTSVFREPPPEAADLVTSSLGIQEAVQNQSGLGWQGP